MFMPWYWATLLITIGLAVCTAVTLSPLSKRKALETAAQATDPDVETLEVARLDGLDAASEGVRE
jgi:UDP-GlcNAc:undecaprenyl-phosphate GlcNAc-1-phosphate transferase